jgi:hypothetical protein
MKMTETQRFDDWSTGQVECGSESDTKWLIEIGTTGSILRYFQKYLNGFLGKERESAEDGHCGISVAYNLRKILKNT